MKISISSLQWSTSLTMILIVILTIWSEFSKPFKTSLANVTGHHWTTKGVLAFVFFVVVYFILMSLFRKDTNEVARSIYMVIVVSLVAGVVIFGFYLWHFFV